MTEKVQILGEWEFQKGKWGLHEWKLRFSNGKRYLGFCDCRKKTIYISKAYLFANPYSVLKDTLLHEISHALQYINHGKTDHGRDWKRIARNVGCAPRRCASTDDIVVPRGKYVGICLSCGKVTHFYRKIRRKYSCRICSNRYDPNYQLRIMSIEQYESESE